jgi:hypothetical protein
LLITYQRKKNLLHFIHRCYNLGDMQRDLRPIFQEYLISRLVIILWHKFREYGKEFQKYARIFSSKQPYVQKPLLVL